MTMLQKPMRGIREFLGSYLRPNDVFGLNSSVNPTVSFEDFLQEPEYVRTGLALNTVGQSVSNIVPAGEIWRVRLVTCEAILAAGEVLGMKMVYFNRDRFYPLEGAVFSSNAAGQNAGNAVFTPNLFLLPEMGVGATVHQITAAGNISITTEALIQRIFI